MDFLKSKKRFSFKIAGKAAFEHPYVVSQIEKDNELITTYDFECGLKVTNIAKKVGRFGAYEWVNYFENTSTGYTPMISDIWDSDVEIDFPKEDEFKYQAVHASREDTTKIYAPTGSLWRAEEFWCDPDELDTNIRINHLFVGQSKVFTASGGRPCEKQAPFFRVQKKDTWFTAAVGWTGQWKAEIERKETEVVFRCGIEKTNFRMVAGEKFRTASVVILKDYGDFEDISNRWRTLIREEYSQVAKRGGEPPFACSNWGGTPSDLMIEKINYIKEHKLPYEYFWVDAGWYGMTKPTLEEFQGDWARHTGDWRISPYSHPDGFKDVVKAVKDAGMKFLLWFEFEQVFETVPMLQEHPDWFLGGDWQKFLNLGKPEAYEYELNTLRYFIKELGLDCYRQDFNGSPVECWRHNDEIDRQGITEIKHINALYKLYDTILEEFPNLIIDNCASGARRIDIEMLRRSVTLSRSDYYCPANFDPEVQQMHHQLYSTWLPYHGACIKTDDIYVVRGGYSSCGATCLLYYQNWRELDIVFHKKVCEEFLRVRSYFSKNFYALTKPSKKLDEWCASQYHDTEKDEGMIQIFKREHSPYVTSKFNLREIDENATYILEDIDKGEKEISGLELKNFTVTIEETRVAKIFIYRKK